MNREMNSYTPKTNGYVPRFGEFAGKTGIMIGRVADQSNNDIQLEFECGSKRWFHYSSVTKVS